MILTGTGSPDSIHSHVYAEGDIYDKPGKPVRVFDVAEVETTASRPNFEGARSVQAEALGIFHAIETRDAVARTRDGWPYFAAHSRGLTPDGQPLFEIQFADGQWMLAVLADLSS